MIATSRCDVRRRLADPGLPGQIAHLGFRGPDVTDLAAAITTVLDSAPDLALVTEGAERLVERIGRFVPGEPESVWPEGSAPDDALGTGVLPMMALVVTAPEVRAFHVRRGIPTDISNATLADLGQQAWVHRMTYGEFGLRTYPWLNLAWSGALYWLGRLQFNLHRVQGPDRTRGSTWVLSTHVPRSGPLTPDSVDASFAAATRFFAAHFPDYPTRDFFCSSWLLDPALPELLPDSNLAAFQRRWQVFGEGQPAEEDVLFFVFGRRPPVDPYALPTDTALRRAVVRRLISGPGWSVRTGRRRQ